MKIKKEDSFKPVIITLETKKEYAAFIEIVCEAEAVSRKDYMGPDAISLAIDMSDYFSNNG